MNTDQKNGAGAYKSDRADDAAAQGRDFKAPFHLRLTKDRDVQVGYREAAIAAGALGLGFLAFKGVKSVLGRATKANAVAAGHSGKLEPVPLATSATPDVKDNAAPRFPEGIDNRVDEPATPFVASSNQDDTGDLVVEVTEVEVVAVAVDDASADQSARTPEHVPTDLMGDKPPTANDRAIDAFRPDPTAPVPPEMRDSLRPATGPAPSLAADRGTFGQGLAQTDGSK
ncbi:hypothetical protein [Sphingomonas lenta]|uniref:Uncharacterized protein n=1 Tax=Sphingomonas lenta TaxID=1141887 RepID=A0A2A2SG42_9SPHN|nr:hypothetical protein [Sphingomonas lenta]PAX08219.1 hypothetical protein CKY28_11665 [Sphingomonas lenta]